MERETEPIRVLHIVGEMGRGGMETMVMNLYRNIDRDKVQFDFLTHYGRPAAYDDEIRSMGGRIYAMPALKRDEQHANYWKIFQYIKALDSFFKEHSEYRILHGHMTNTASIYMPIAKKYGVTTRIAHSHSTHGKAGMLGVVTNLLQKPTYKVSTDWFACSKQAAYWFYPKESVEAGKVKIVPNAVDAEKFRFNQATRNRIRNELRLNGLIVIGCVARFREEKNQSFLIDVLKNALKIEPQIALLFAGEGPLEDEVKKKATEEGLMDKCLFLGMRSDIPNLMQAIDVLAMPSLFEGLPVTGIEAQASGLHIIASTGVTEEMNAIDMCEFVDLNEGPDKWAEILLKKATIPREDTFVQIKAAGFDIHTTAPWLQEFYLERADR